MIEVRDIESNKVLFIAWGPGVVVPTPSTDNIANDKQIYIALYEDFKAKKQWCEEQGWIRNRDFLTPGVMIKAKWFFKTHEQQMQFAMRWS